jgi:hypothetical protein
MFSHSIYFVKTFYKFCSFSAICNDNAAINSVTVQHKNGSFPSTLTGHKLLLVIQVKSYKDLGQDGDEQRISTNRSDM